MGCVCREIERERNSVCREIESGCVCREIERVYVCREIERKCMYVER